MFKRKIRLINHFYLSKFLLIILSALICQVALFSQKENLNELEKKVSKWLNISPVSLEQVYGGLTNTSFSSTNQNDTFIMRLGKENPEIFGIDRFCETACQKSASQVGIAPKILYSDHKNGTLISTFINGKTYSAEDVSDSVNLKCIIELLKKCHSIPFKEEFKTSSIYEKIRTMISLSQSHKPSLVSQKEAEKIKDTINQIETYFSKTEKKYEGLCHGDLYPRNFMEDKNQLWLIDWEYASWGNILFDLASLCIESNFDEQKIKETLKLYFGQTWQENYFDFELMCALFNLYDAFWYDLRDKELKSIDEVNMLDCAKKHFELFKQAIDKLFNNPKFLT